MINKVQDVQGNGYATHFECRPEFLFDLVIKEVVDANIKEHPVNGLMAARIEDVFFGKDEVFLDFGKPNTALVISKQDGTGYQKFSAFSLWRKKSEIEDVTRKTGSYVQSGIWVRIIGLPDQAKINIRRSMEKFSGKKFRTCVRGNMMVLDHAGFTLGKKKLNRYTWPNSLMKNLFKHGLSFQGRPVSFEVVRTTRATLQDYRWNIRMAELTTPWRHCSNNPFGSGLDNLIRKPFYWLVPRSKRSLPRSCNVAPALPGDISYDKDIVVRVTSSMLPAQMLRQVFGPHAFFEALTNRINIDNYFTGALMPFPQKNPSLVTCIKKSIVFSRFAIWLYREFLGASRFVDIGLCSERDVYNMLRTHCDLAPNKYNLVVVRVPPLETEDNPATRFILSRITVRTKFVDWVLSKHVLMSGYLWAPKTENEKPDKTTSYVVWAGECYKTMSGVITLEGNSGTYQPKPEQDEQMLKLARDTLPHIILEISAR